MLRLSLFLLVLFVVNGCCAHVSCQNCQQASCTFTTSQPQFVPTILGISAIFSMTEECFRKVNPNLLTGPNADNIEVVLNEQVNVYCSCQKGHCNFPSPKTNITVANFLSQSGSSISDECFYYLNPSFDSEQDIIPVGSKLTSPGICPECINEGCRYRSIVAVDPASVASMYSVSTECIVSILNPNILVDPDSEKFPADYAIVVPGDNSSCVGMIVDGIQCDTEHPCASGQCKHGVCEVTSGQRVTDSDCSDAQQCVSGKCFPICTDAAGNQCLENSTCINGQCFKICSSFHECSIGEECSSSLCVPVSCSDDLNCTRGGVCKNGFCKDPSACSSDTDCSNNGSCIANVCKKLCSNFTDCSAGEDCKDGFFSLVRCGVNETCPPGSVCRNETCVDPRICNIDAECDYGNVCKHGYCKPVNSCVSSNECMNGHQCINATCLKVCAHMNDCEPGDSCEVLVCVPTFCSTDAHCPPNTLCNNGRCVNNVCSTNSECRNGWECKNGKCSPQPQCILNSHCSKGEVCEKGLCVPSPKCYYTVSDGDTLSNLIYKFNITLAELIEENPFLGTNGGVIVGQRIKVPCDVNIVLPQCNDPCNPQCGLFGCFRAKLKFLCGTETSSRWRLTNTGHDLSGLIWFVIDGKGNKIADSIDTLPEDSSVILNIPFRDLTLHIAKDTKTLTTADPLLRQCVECDDTKSMFESVTHVRTEKVFFLTSNSAQYDHSNCKAWYIISPRYIPTTGSVVNPQFSGLAYYKKGSQRKLVTKEILPFKILSTRCKYDSCIYTVSFYGSEEEFVLRSKDLETVDFHPAVISTLQLEQILGKVQSDDFIYISKSYGDFEVKSSLEISSPVKIYQDKKADTFVCEGSFPMFSLITRNEKHLRGVELRNIRADNCESFVKIENSGYMADLVVDSCVATNLKTIFVYEAYGATEAYASHVHCGYKYKGLLERFSIVGNNITFSTENDNPTFKALDFSSDTLKKEINIMKNVMFTEKEDDSPKIHLHNAIDCRIMKNVLKGFSLDPKNTGSADFNSALLYFSGDLISLAIIENKIENILNYPLIFIDNKDKGDDPVLRTITDIDISNNEVDSYKLTTMGVSLGAFPIQVGQMKDILSQLSAFSGTGNTVKSLVKSSGVFSSIGSIKIQGNDITVSDHTVDQRIPVKSSIISLQLSDSHVVDSQSYGECAVKRAGPIYINKNILNFNFHIGSNTYCDSKNRITSFVSVNVENPVHFHYDSSKIEDQYLVITQNQLKYDFDPSTCSHFSTALEIVYDFDEYTRNQDQSIAYIAYNDIFNFDTAIYVQSTGMVTDHDKPLAMILYNSFVDCNINFKYKSPPFYGNAIIQLRDKKGKIITIDTLEEYLDFATNTFIVNNNYYGGEVNNAKDFKMCWSSQSFSDCLCSNRMACFVSDMCYGNNNLYISSQVQSSLYGDPSLKTLLESNSKKFGDCITPIDPKMEKLLIFTNSLMNYTNNAIETYAETVSYNIGNLSTELVSKIKDTEASLNSNFQDKMTNLSQQVDGKMLTVIDMKIRSSEFEDFLEHFLQSHNYTKHCFEDRCRDPDDDILPSSSFLMCFILIIVCLIVTFIIEVQEDIINYTANLEFLRQAHK